MERGFLDWGGCFFFFFKQKTAYEIGWCDWSSDVCSSDLRGDGVAIGPGQDRSWDPVLLDEAQTWAFDFRGLWGVSVKDPFEGEEAPAGPVYNRDASIRASWADPLGFAALDGVPPPDREAEVLGERRASLEG